MIPINKRCQILHGGFLTKAVLQIKKNTLKKNKKNTFQLEDCGSGL